MTDITLLDGERIDAVNEKINLIQKKDGLTFGTDAFLLASFIKPRAHGRAAELGAGTGIISLLLAAREKFGSICAFEIQEDFAELARRNTALNSLDHKIEIVCRDVRDIRSQEYGEFDAVFTNPPYMKTESGKRNESDYKYIARHEVCGNIYDFCSAAAKILKFGGKFYCVYRPDRLADLIDAARKASLEPKRVMFVHPDKSSEPSVVLVEAVKGGASSMHVSPPLFIYDSDDRSSSNRKMSEKALSVYDTCML